jgi:transcription initiation factor TFIIIB Brf1 subunit/transcription initiation factor TFIIB
MDARQACKHQRIQVIAKDSDAEYIECLDCGAVLEKEELTEEQKSEPPNFDESLSDA